MTLRRSRRAAGFTLIELLAAMTILTIMVLLISRILADSTKVWQVGTKRVENNADGRAAVDFMVRELAAALCDDQTGPLGLKLESGFSTSLGMDPDRIFFVSSDQIAERRGNSYRQGRQVVYDVVSTSNIWRLVRYGVEDMAKPSYTCYAPGGFPSDVSGNTYRSWDAQVLAENVRTLEFWIYDTNGVQHSDYTSAVHGRPGWIEVYLEILGKDNSIKAALMGTRADDYCNRNVRRYVGRAYLQANGGRP